LRSHQIHRLFDYTSKPFEFKEIEPVPARQRQHRLTSAEMVAVARAYGAGVSMKQLAIDFRVHRTTIAGCLKKLGIPIRVLGLPAELEEQMINFYQAGWSLMRLGAHYDCDAETIRQVLIRKGVPRRGACER
jgi:hypothetical protein